LRRVPWGAGNVATVKSVTAPARVATGRHRFWLARRAGGPCHEMIRIDHAKHVSEERSID
jgi:hypothetical protein